MDHLLTAKDVAAVLKVHPNTVYEKARRGLIPCIKAGPSEVRFSRKEISRWLDNHSQKSIPVWFPKISFNLDEYDKILLKGGKSALGKNPKRWNYGFGSVYVRSTKDGRERSYIDFIIDGRRIRELVKFAQTRSEAILHLQMRISEAIQDAHGLEGSKGKTTFAEFAETYLKDYAKANKRSWRSDESRPRVSLTPTFGAFRLKEITPLQIEQYRAKRLESGAARGTINRELALMKRMFNLAIDWRFAKENPVRKVRFFSRKDNLKERILTKEEESALLSLCSPYLKAIVLVALNTGMRLGEILGLQ